MGKPNGFLAVVVVQYLLRNSLPQREEASIAASIVPQISNPGLTGKAYLLEVLYPINHGILRPG
jgi:hypothetical protein